MSTHPDLVRQWVRRITYTAAGAERYEVFPNSAYVLSARLVGVGSTNQFTVVLFTSEAPTVAGTDDEPKLALYLDTNGRTDSFGSYPPHSDGGIFFDNGIYAYTEGATDGDEAFLQVLYVPRLQYCAAFPYPEQSLLECWEAAHPGVPIYENFWNYERDNPEAPVETPADGSVGDPI